MAPHFGSVAQSLALARKDLAHALRRKAKRDESGPDIGDLSIFDNQAVAQLYDRGRRREPVSKKATWQKLMNELVSLHEKGKTRRVTKYECLCLSHLTKAIKGDTRSTKFVIEEAERAGFGDLGAERALIPQDSITPSGLLFESIDPNLLLDDEKVELARLATIMDLGGGFTALSTHDFERAKQIANKGKGKDITL
jgi:hypothetical protein